MRGRSRIRAAITPLRPSSDRFADRQFDADSESGADGGTRTRTPRGAGDFKSPASTGSATSAPPWHAMIALAAKGGCIESIWNKEGVEPCACASGTTPQSAVARSLDVGADRLELFLERLVA